MAMFDPVSGEFTYCNAGHNPPFLVRASGKVERLLTGGPVLGVLRTVTYQAASERLDPNDLVVLYSDGVTEARNAEDEEYDEGPLLDEVMQRRTLPAPQIVTGVHDALERFLGSTAANDDITLVVVRRVPS